MRFLLTALLLSLSSTALAVPMNFTHQGRLFDPSGVPIDAPTDITFRLFDASSSGAVLWEEVHTGMAFDNGYYSTTMGSINPLLEATFDGATLYMEMQVGTAAPLPQRIAVVSVPYAVRAGVAGDLDAGVVIDAAEIQINGTTVIDATGSIDGSLISGYVDTLSGLSCADGQVAKVIGGSWACGDDTDTDTVYTDAMAVSALSAHTSAADAHHAPYTDGMAITALVGHTGAIDAHHAKYTNGEAVSALGSHTGDNNAHHTAYIDADAQVLVDELACLIRTGTWTGSVCEEPIQIVANSQPANNPNAMTTCSSRTDGYTQLATAWELMNWYNAQTDKPAIGWVWALGSDQKYTQSPYTELLQCGAALRPLCRAGEEGRFGPAGNKGSSINGQGYMTCMCYGPDTGRTVACAKP